MSHSTRNRLVDRRGQLIQLGRDQAGAQIHAHPGRVDRRPLDEPAVERTASCAAATES